MTRLSLRRFSLLPFLLGWASIWLICSTLRYRVVGWDHFQHFKERKDPVILAFWHNQIFSAVHFWRFRGIVAVASRHFDGEYIARIIRAFGYGVARGSSSHGGLQALAQLKEHLLNERDVALTVDGPRGPLYRAKPGVLWLSRRTRAFIVPFQMEPERFWSLNSWDALRIPKPFSRVLVQIGEPFRVPTKTRSKDFLPILQERMEELQKEARQYWQAQLLHSIKSP